MSLLNWLSGNADTEQKLQTLDYQVSATNRFILERDETIQQLRKDLGNLQNNVYEATQLIVMLQQRVYKLEEAAQAAKATAVKAKATALGSAGYNDAQAFYHHMGGYDVMKKLLRGKYSKTRVYISRYKAREDHPEYWVLRFGTRERGLSKAKGFKTRLEAERFAFDLLQIHDGECNKRRASTKWWDGVNIFEVTPNRRSS